MSPGWLEIRTCKTTLCTNMHLNEKRLKFTLSSIKCGKSHTELPIATNKI